MEGGANNSIARDPPQTATWERELQEQVGGRRNRNTWTACPLLISTMSACSLARTLGNNDGSICFAIGQSASERVGVAVINNGL